MIALLASYRRDLRAARPEARAYLLGSALIGAAGAIVFTLFARWLDALGFDKAQVGGLQSAENWGKTLVALPAALLIARRSSRQVFVVAALVGGAAYMALPLAARLEGRAAYWAITGLQFTAGLALTTHYVAIAPFLFRVSGPRERAGLFGFAEAVRTLSAVVGAGLAGLTVQMAVERLAGDADVATRTAAEARAGGWVMVAAGACAWGASLCFARIRDGQVQRAAPRPLLPLLRTHARTIVRFALPQGVVAMGAGFCIPFLPLYFKDRFGYEPGAWGALFAAGQVLMTFGFLLTPVCIGRLGFVRSQVAIELASIPFFLLLAFTGRAEVAVLAFLMRGALMNSTHPIHKHLMMRATAAEAREVQTGVNAVLWGLGWTLGPLLGGAVLERTGSDYGVLMVSTSLLYVLAATLTFLLLRPLERGLPPEEDAASAIGAAVAAPGTPPLAVDLRPAGPGSADPASGGVAGAPAHRRED